MKIKIYKSYGEYIYEDGIDRIKFRTPGELIDFIESRENRRLTKAEKEDVYNL